MVDDPIGDQMVSKSLYIKGIAGAAMINGHEIPDRCSRSPVADTRCVEPSL